MESASRHVAKRLTAQQRREQDEAEERERREMLAAAEAQRVGGLGRVHFEPPAIVLAACFTAATMLT